MIFISLVIRLEEWSTIVFFEVKKAQAIFNSNENLSVK